MLSSPNPFLTSDHVKTLIVDRDLAFVGGMNIGREYRYEWHDMMVELRGPIVAPLASDFERSWVHTSAGDVGFLPTASFCGRLRGADDRLRLIVIARRCCQDKGAIADGVGEAVIKLRAVEDAVGARRHHPRPVVRPALHRLDQP